ncbi:serine hydrolase domain-containing protein, partial [Streptomyces erythrochromogenes]|uniref:serine hydrolase domain-containing protein n=1 Tax=Streptomyces erythrochromogenes TaxID=285574 RepID=UPI0036BB5832
MAQELGTLAQQTADRLAEKHVGVVVAAVAEDVVEIRGAGSTGADDGRTPGPDTLFEIGSVTKPFTALALARLASTGRAGLDEPLADLLPAGTSVPSRDGRQISLQHLATHTSGLPRLPRGMLLPALLHPSKPDPYADCTADALLAGLARTRLGAVPGKRFRYSNLGAGLLGLALARRAGTDYESLITREICAPLGMTDTVVTLGGARSRRSAQGHARRGRPVSPWHLADLAGAGALRATATDLVAFVRAQLDGGPEELAEAIRLSRSGGH